MSAPHLELADIIRRFGKDFIVRHNPGSYKIRVLNAITVCRTPQLGGHSYVCEHCGVVHKVYNSCGNRHCPKCQGANQAVWVEQLLEDTLPVKHYHIVFTLPHALNDICLAFPQKYYGILFDAAWNTLRQFGYTHFGVEPGAVAVLHTWGQSLVLHPHIHFIVAAAGLTLSGNLKHIGASGKFLFPVKQLSVVFKTKFLQVLERFLIKNGCHHKFLPDITYSRSLKWSVHSEPSLASPEHVVRYLGLYTHRVAISNNRIINVNEQGVTFFHKDYANNARVKPMFLNGVEFLRRFCLHILPKGFVKIRRYGIYSSRYKAIIKSARDKLPVKKTAINTDSLAEILKMLTGIDVWICPYCKAGRLIKLEELPKIRSPDSLYEIINSSEC